MKYLGESNFEHGSKEQIGVLLTNLGTPDAPTPKALRRYLAEFLWDPRVVETPRWIWWLILHVIILNIRPAKSAKVYRKIWRDTGSPLLTISHSQREALAKTLKIQANGGVEVVLAMRYGSPSIQSGLKALRDMGARRLLIVPLYPQYCAATTASTVDAFTEILKTWRWIPEIRFINGYCDDAGYINTAAKRINDHWAAHGRGDLLLFSYHGIPKRYFLAGDPYHCQCHKTARLVAQALGLNDNEWQLSFQSRFGREEWLKPYTDHVLEQLPSQHVKAVDMFCPGFAADCLETLEENNMQNRDLFLKAGGEKFNYIPALNDMPEHIDALTQLIMRHLQGWPEVRPDYDQAQVEQALAESKRRALAMGAKQ